MKSMLICLPLVALATNSTSDDDLGGVEIWEIALAGGVGILALFLCCIAFYLYRTRPRRVETAIAPTPIAPPPDPAPPAAARISGMNKTTAKPPPQVAVGPVGKAKEAIKGPQGCRFDGMQKNFPKHWGCPDDSVLKSTGSIVLLPDNYGRGTVQMQRWIQFQMLTDERRKKGLDPLQKKPFPPTWKNKPVLTSEEKSGKVVDAPGGYGAFPPRMAAWIEENINRDART